MRVFILTPLQGQEAPVSNLLNALDGIFAQQEGYVLGLQFTGIDDSPEVGRIFVWDNRETADRGEASAEATSIFQRLAELSQSGATETTYRLQGYALKPR